MKNVKLFEDWMETETPRSAHPLSGTDSGQADLNAALLIELNKTAESMDIKKIKELINQGAYIKLKNSRGENILLWAAHFNDVELAKMCIDKGIPVDERDGGGNTPLHWAIDNGLGNKTLQVTLYLLEKGADVMNCSANHGNALALAVQRSSQDIGKAVANKMEELW